MTTHEITTSNGHKVTVSCWKSNALNFQIHIDGSHYSDGSSLIGAGDTEESEAEHQARQTATEIEEKTLNFDACAAAIKAILTQEQWEWALENVDEFDVLHRNQFDLSRVAADLQRAYAADIEANRIDRENHTSFVITASNHGLNNIPCNMNAGLFGEFAAKDQPFSESSREFATRVEAEAALQILNTTGEWPDGRPDYEIEEVE